MLIYSPPQILQKYLIYMPLVPRSRVLTAKLLRVGLPELTAPIPHGFIGQDDATLLP
jgi:hypothetical protein